MKLRKIAFAVLIGSSILAPAMAQDSVARASAASVESVGAVGQSVGWAVHAGSEFTVTAVKASAQGVELSLKGVSEGIETSATIAKGLAEAASIAVGTSVKVVAEATGYALMAAGRMIAFVPNEIGRGLVHRSGH